MNIFLVRHGETLLNLLKKNQGWIDSDLSKEGIENLHQIFQYNNLPEIGHIFCSDLGRAKRTLEVLSPYMINSDHIEVTYTSNLRERFLGSFEGDSLPNNRLTIANKEGYDNFDEYMLKKTFWDFVDATKKYDPINLAENFTEFASRVDSIISEIKQSGEESVLVVSHANTIRYITETLTQKSIELEITNGKVVKLSGNKDKWVLVEDS